MYIDFVKNDYSDKSESEAAQHIEQDKIHLGKIIQERIRNEISEIAERWYELDDIGYYKINERFFDLLKEAENLYSFGYYIGTISVIGITSEEFCKYMASNNNIQDTDLKQIDRLKLLKSRNVISRATFRHFNTIRAIRNDCVHFNVNFKRLSQDELKERAIKAINCYKAGLKETISPEELPVDEVLEKLISNTRLSFEDFKLRQRNIYKIKNGIDLKIAPGIKNLSFTSNYYIAEIDITTDLFKEMTLFDIETGGIVVVDLTLPQVKMIEEMQLEVGNVILATLLSRVSSVGQSEEWFLLNIADVYYGHYVI
ncbi:hypothetical protein [Cohnella sp. REN36]|uniref:hypothetical protein n=1 Tax=Cohnella sp. REN36 TaxID=2887347 RepID=UPI001D14E12A|nr:hypothetical protein [Cohnella sp. REN36]MCC3372164.1 hypothetical protein [Cohnella sp. REN36]